MPTPRPMRLAVVAYHSSPLTDPGAGDSGGMTVYVREVAHELAALGIRTDIFTRATMDVGRIGELSPGVRVVAIDAGPRRAVPKEDLPGYLDEFVQGVRAFSLSQRIGYDALHSHYWQSGVAGWQLARAWGVPHVHSAHTLGRVKNSNLAPGDSAEPAYRLEGEAEVISNADVLIASTGEELDQLAGLYGASPDRLKVLHPGVDHTVFSPGGRAEARAALGLDPEAAVMLYVGRIQPLKGLDLAVRAVEQLVPALGRPLSLVVVGGASGAGGTAELERLQTLARTLDVEEHVTFVGPQPHRDVPTYYRAADVLAVCSHSESFGLAALEAHACGTPVVATAVGGLSHIVDDGVTGWLLADRDPSDFAGRMKTLLSDPDLARSFGRAAHARALGFSWEKSASSLLELYDCLVRERLPEACTC
ncbi:MAG TPA: glycosyltransferase [Actinomycetota bacterium]|nr:glycosyltransferase [Actinomycetota bacterium]